MMSYRALIGIFSTCALLCGCTRMHVPMDELIESPALSGYVTEGRYVSPSKAFSVSIPPAAGSLLISDNFNAPDQYPDEGQVYFTDVKTDGMRITLVNFSPADPTIAWDDLISITEIIETSFEDKILKPLQIGVNFHLLTREYVNWAEDEQYLITGQSIEPGHCDPGSYWVYVIGRYPKGSVCILIEDKFDTPLSGRNINDEYWKEMVNYAYKLFLSFR